jgi:SAM-dependent methyltransferase
MYDALLELARRPEPWSRTTVRELWTRPHLAQQMLKYHLSQETDHSSRRTAQIDDIVDWLDAQLDLDGMRVIDLGCGPGLYARRMARRGARVTGVDFSAHSLDYARGRDSENIAYLEADYLLDPLPDGFDMAAIIYYDYCALAPDNRRRLLERVHSLLNPGGRLVLDLYGPGAFDAVGEHLEFGERLMDGFFAPGDYVGVHKTDVYEDDWLSLDRFLVVEPRETWQLYNWCQYYSPESAAAELSEAGFMVAAMTGGLDGQALADDNKTIGVIAEKT